MPERPEISGSTAVVVANPDDLLVGRHGERNPRAMDIVSPQQMVRNETARGMNDSDCSAQGEPLVALEVQQRRKCARELSGAVRLIERGRYLDRPRGNVGMRAAGGAQTQAEKCKPPKLKSQDDAPLCFRPFEGYYSSRVARRHIFPG